MRKIYTCLVAFGLIINSLQAQEIPHSLRKGFGFGVFAGLNRSTPLLTASQQGVSLPAHSNLLVGADVHFRLNQRSSLHIQPAWTRIDQAGSTSNDWPNNLGLTISTAKIPLLYRYTILSTKIVPFVEIGIGYNHILNSTYHEPTFVICDPGPCPVNLYSGVDYSLTNKAAMSVIGSLGVDINLKTISIPITLRYERYTNDYTFSTSWFNTNSQLRFENIALMTGINF